MATATKRTKAIKPAAPKREPVATVSGESCACTFVPGATWNIWLRIHRPWCSERRVCPGELLIDGRPVTVPELIAWLATVRRPPVTLYSVAGLKVYVRAEFETPSADRRPLWTHKRDQAVQRPETVFGTGKELR